MGKGDVSVIHSSEKGSRQIEVVHGPGTSAMEIEIHSDVAKELAKNQGVYGIAYRKLVGEHNYKPSTRGEEVHFEVAKHEKLVEHYESAVSGGAVELKPRLEQLRDSLATHRVELEEIKANPEVGDLPGLGQVDVKQTRAAMIEVPRSGKISEAAAMPVDVITDPALVSQYPNARHVNLGDTVVVNGEKVSKLGVSLSENGSFRRSGGQVFVDENSGAVILSINMVTKENSNTLIRAEVPYVRNSKGEWRADFSQHNVLGSNKAIQLAKGLKDVRKDHFMDANKKLADALKADPDLKTELGFSDKLVELLGKGYGGNSPPNFTWHHVNDSGEMMLVDTFTHDMFTHTGGMSEMRK